MDTDRHKDRFLLFYLLEDGFCYHREEKDSKGSMFQDSILSEKVSG